jgi:hypothetical protein
VSAATVSCDSAETNTTAAAAAAATSSQTNNNAYTEAAAAEDKVTTCGYMLPCSASQNVLLYLFIYLFKVIYILGLALQ